MSATPLRENAADQQPDLPHQMQIWVKDMTHDMALRRHSTPSPIPCSVELQRDPAWSEARCPYPIVSIASTEE